MAYRLLSLNITIINYLYTELFGSNGRGSAVIKQSKCLVFGDVGVDIILLSLSIRLFLTVQK